MRKDEVEKEPSTLYLEKDIKFLAKSEQVNLSGLVNDLLRTYFSVGSKEEIYKEIEKHREQLLVLEKKLKQFEVEGKAETKVAATADANWERAHEVFGTRMESDTGEAGAREWVKNARATEALRKSGFSVDTILDKLLERAHGL